MIKKIVFPYLINAKLMTIKETVLPAIKDMILNKDSVSSPNLTVQNQLILAVVYGTGIIKLA